MDSLFTQLKVHVLGKRYDLSVAFLSSAKMRKAMMYKKPRRLRSKVGVPTETSGKDKASNVLAFPLSKTSGEILICKATAKSEAKLYNMTPDTFVNYLFIHGLLHLKGHPHGATMENEERRIMRRFSLRVDEQSSNRN